MKTVRNFIAASLSILLLAGCDFSGKPDNFDYGHVEKGVYRNNYFNFSIVLPANWVVQSKEQIEDITKTGKDLITGDDEKMKAILKASEVNSANLMAVFQYELGTPVDYNPSIMIIAENIKRFPGIKNGSDYLFQSQKLLKKSQFKYDYLSDKFENIKIDNIDFFKMDAYLNLMGTEVRQEYYSTVMDGFSLNLIISYNSDEQKTMLMNSINSMEFSD